MKTKSSNLGTALIRLFALVMGLLVGQTLLADVAFTVTPSAVSNTWNGVITLQVSGLTTGDTVVVQKYLDANTNGVIDNGDLLVQQFTLQDGTNSVIGGVTNFNVPGDLNATTGAITAKLDFQNGDFMQNVVGNFLYRLSNPGGHFEPLTNQFVVTSFPFPQMFTGNVVSNGLAVSQAVVLLFIPNHGPVAGVVADNSGSYTIAAPAGTYSPVAFKSNYVANMGAAPVLTLAASQTITTNLALAVATTSISGNVVDANNSSIGLTGMLVPAMSADGLLAVAFTDTNGNFNAPVTAGTWEIKGDDTTLIVHGYPGLENGITVDTTTGSVANVTIALPKGTALFYGNVSDTSGNPLAVVDVYVEDNDSYQYQTDGYTGTNGNYFAAVPAGNWRVEIDSVNSPANYIFPNGQGLTLTNGQATNLNFNALLATNYITGSLKDNIGNPIEGVGIWADATFSNTDYRVEVDTDSNGNYSLTVANSNAWTVGVETCSDCDNGLPGGYLPPDNQTVGITNNNGTVNFIAQPCGGISIIPAFFPAGEVNVYYSQFLLAASCNGNVTGSLISGSLPPGLTANTSSGQIYGTPTNVGTFTFTVQLSDGVNTTNREFSISISNAVQITTTSLPDGMNSSAYSQQLQAIAGVPFDGESPYSWSLASGSASLPANLTLATNGLLSGTLAESGTFDFTVEVTDSLGGSYDQPLSLNIGSPPDALEYYVMKMESFLQTNTANVVPDTTYGPFNAVLGIIQSSLDTVPISLVDLPSGTVKGFPLGSSGITLQVIDSFGSQAALDADYASGDYMFAMATADNGFQFPVLTMPVAVYPAAVCISNFAAAQAINPFSAFTLQWSVPPDATANDFIWVTITDGSGNVVFSTPEPSLNASAALRGTATSVLVPMNTFQLGNTYTGFISFIRATSINQAAYPGATGLTLVSVRTRFSMVTPSTAPSTAPVLSQPALASGAQFGFQLMGVAGQDYTVEYSTNLTDWIPLLTTNLPEVAYLYINVPLTNQAGFFRAYESGIGVSQSVIYVGTGDFGPPVLNVNVTNGVAVVPLSRTQGLSNEVRAKKALSNDVPGPMDLSDEVCVNYTTSDGTAVGGCDYTPTSGALCFPADVTRNSISIPVSFGCNTTNQSVTVNLYLSDTNGTAMLRTVLVMQRPLPVLTVYPNSLTNVLPEIGCSTYYWGPSNFTIRNDGPPGSVLNYVVADDGALGGFLDFNGVQEPVFGSLSSGNATNVLVSVDDRFVNDWWGLATLVVDVYTPDIHPKLSNPVSVTVDSWQTMLQGPWSGGWSSGSWSVSFDQLTLTNLAGIPSWMTFAASGTVTLAGSPITYQYYDCTLQTNLTGEYSMNRTFQFDNAILEGWDDPCDGLTAFGISYTDVEPGSDGYLITNTISIRPMSLFVDPFSLTYHSDPEYNVSHIEVQISVGRPDDCGGGTMDYRSGFFP